MTKNTWAIEMPVKTAKIQEIDRPISAAKSQKTTCAVASDMRLSPAQKAKTTASGANMITHLSGEVNIACSTPAGMMSVGSPATARAKSVPTTQATSAGDDHRHGHQAVDLVHVGAQTFVDLRGAYAGASPTNSLEFGHRFPPLDPAPADRARGFAAEYR